ncbi:zinc finger BED domain-containing protein 1-like [Sinocyclocheilus rhinocerous]|uniref:zinc finger BED domain-containing protein 1-like n=1 Tax=Sinocyclocheilus rhinocerous TaxID=307959 RepID=UPI0007BACFC5|nr:PREDICTED: zinc finger BED domain-containing protein 1-like [Sinocyclocheilus rhinocerous]
MNKKRTQFAKDLHRGRRHRDFPRDTFMPLPYRRVYGRQSRLESDRKWSNGRPTLHAQQNRPYNQQELPTNRGHGSNVKTLLNIIIKDLQPLSAVTRHHLTRTLQSSLDLQLSASWLRNELQSLYGHERVEVQNAVNNASNLALSAELWSSSEKVFYLTVSCHLISENWKLKSYVLDTAHLLTKHTAENAAEHLLRISNEWNVTEKTQIVVTNVDGIKKAHTNGCRWTYIPCFAYTLDKVFRETILRTDCESLLRKCQQIVAFFHQNYKASQNLQEYCASLNLQRSELTQSCGLKWLPTLHMLKNISEQWKAIFKVFVNRRVDDLCLNENERKIIENIVAVLDIMKDVTEEVLSRGFSPISNIIPLVQKLQKRLRNQSVVKNGIAKKLSEMCDFHIGNIKQNIWFRVSTALDPRYKTSVLQDSGIEDITAEIRKQIRGDPHTAVHCSHDTESEESVFQKYWKTTSISVNALEFWKTNEELKKLATVARKYLTVVSTAIPVERVHQLQESRLVDRRNCLEPENVNMILFLNSNQ